MKIAIVTSVDLSTLGGVEVTMNSMYPAYRKQNIECVFFVPFKNYKHLKKINYPVKLLPPFIFSLSMKIYFIKHLLFKLYLYLFIKGKYEVLHIHGAYPAGVTFSKYISFLEMPVILHSRAADIQVCPEINYGARISADINRHVEQSVIQYKHHISTNMNIAKILHEMGVSESAISVINNGTYLDKFELNFDRIEYRDILGVDDNEILFISIGRNNTVKGYEFAIKTFNLVKNKSNFKYYIYGKNVKDLQSLVNDLDLQKNVLLNNSITGDELIKTFKSADAYILPSYIEGFPLTKAEALAAGLPVVTTNRPGCVDALKDGYNGLIADKRDESLFAEKIECILNNKNLLENMKVNARESAKELDWNSIVLKYKSIYEKLLSEASA